jgi:dihydroorotate dehydrogenase
MGFPNCGIESAMKGLQRLGGRNRKFVLGASIGKQMGTPLEQAHEDYAFLMDRSFEYIDYFAINISSPNTPRLRELQNSEQLEKLLNLLQQVNRNLALQYETQPRPLLLKISPDLSWNQLDAVLDVSLQCGIRGIIATNTTIDRTGLKSGHRTEIGGLSGRPLVERSNEIIRYIVRNCSERLPIIGVGGVFDVEDVKEKIDAGAVLVQIFTGFIYQGPGIVGEILRSYRS